MLPSPLSVWECPTLSEVSWTQKVPGDVITASFNTWPRDMLPETVCRISVKFLHEHSSTGGKISAGPTFWSRLISMCLMSHLLWNWHQIRSLTRFLIKSVQNVWNHVSNHLILWFLSMFWSRFNRFLISSKCMYNWQSQHVAEITELWSELLTWQKNSACFVFVEPAVCFVCFGFLSSLLHIQICKEIVGLPELFLILFLSSYTQSA